MTLKKNKFIKDIIKNKYKNIVFKNNEYKKRYDFQLYLEQEKSKKKNQKSHNCESCEFFYRNIFME